ncbi:putative mitochondrial outer membrane protein [Colletotrichum chlorophyti]|uniref:Putative mitochondrial outer membrane protein n=1 Tax=Colletotrichum chlorophyti TaxID=708187 RepID=A0A1Q8S820_9PEZI|nr:putative mitochondrial outer membrane protein [Colletotrichum chlorophyti]
MATLAPYHIISYATLLGTSLFQTFVNTKVCYSELPKSAFTTLQKRLFPIYFRCQTFLLVLTAVTFPPHGPASLLREKLDWIPFAVAGLTAMTNLFIYGPKTRQAMIDRIHQGMLPPPPRTRMELSVTDARALAETRDAKRPGAVDEPSPDMHAVRRRFSVNHAMSIHLNIISIVAMLWYGIRLASRLNSS